MKRMLSLLAALVFALSAGGCAASNHTYYQQAQRYLGAGEYQAAAQLFNQLGGYADSADYTLYAAALLALQQGDRQLARATLRQVDPFQHSSRYLTYLDAGDLAAADDLEAAISLYESLGAFADSQEQAQLLRADIPARDVRRAQTLMHSGAWHQALALLTPYAGEEDADALLTRCREGIRQAAYDAAADLYAAGEYEQALAAFEALGDALDAKARVLTCRSALYSQAEQAYAVVTLDTCEALMARYAEMDGYLDSAARLASLQDRFATNLALRDMAPRLPYAVYGSYPVEENGAAQPLSWQVLGVTGGVATLLCTQVIDAMPLASATDLTLLDDTPLALPDQEQIAPLAETACTATPYALAQGAQHHSDGRAWWWLADQRPDNRRAVVWYNGSILEGGVAEDEPTIGVRPVAYVDLNKYAFTLGTGSREDPFR